MKKFLSFILTFCLVIGLITVPSNQVDAATVPSNANLLNTYGSLFGHVGTCVTPNQWNDANTKNFILGEYNSITMENEMKPDAVLRQTTISVAQGKENGYYIPSSYTESTVPTLNFSTIDSMMKNAYDNGLQIRYHTLVWHSQTPDWLFRTGYTSYGSYVSKSQMNARMEFYIKSIMYHVYSSPYADVVYCWDVVNEYIHAQSSGWLSIYGAVNTRPDFVKLAFQYAYQALEHFNKQNSVSLFYNDYNTYMDCDKIITMINYINEEKKICAGIGMQSHLSSTFPSASYYKAALDKFAAQGYEIQITELDAKGNDNTDQANYYYNIMSSILSTKKAGGNITAVIWWGLHDGTSWRTGDNPLLFSSLGEKKPSYNSVLQAYFDAGFTVGSTSGTTPSNNTMGATKKLDDGWYYIKNVNAQKYLQVADNTGKAIQNVEIGTGTGVAGQKWYLTNTSDGYITLTSALGDFMLDVANAEDADGANIQIYNAYAGDAQKFIIKATSTDGVYTIGTKASNVTKMLDVYNFGKEDGTNVCQWTFGGYSNQQWIFEKTNYNAPSTSTEPTTSSNPSTSTGLPSGVTCEYSVVSDWGSSFQAQIVLSNNSSNTYNGWNLSFDYNSTINNLWGAELVSQTGTKVVVTNPSWDATLAPGGSVTINFTANLGSDKNAPTNYSFN